jgi:hypothetical protein|tara:strand:- start:580 stop:780 length:201 start_codon:yes stop_codon:yes gene_type:complete
MTTLITLLIFVAGFIVGALVTRKNLKEVNAVVAEAKEFAAKVDAKLDDLQAPKKPATRGRKPKSTK